MHRNRAVILVVLIPLLLVSYVLFLMPSDSSPNNSVLSASRKLLATYVLPNDSLNRYVVIFDGGSSGSRVHVFCFDENLDLVPIGDEIELFEKLWPGLSSYADDPNAAADSLLPLLEKAEDVVPKDIQPDTPVKLGATAGLRQIGDDAAEKILQAVRDLLNTNSSFKTNDDWVSVLDGSEEGGYLWMSINYLLTNIGKNYSETVGVVDLGGGSVQMAYAISQAEAIKAPKVKPEEDPYVKELYLMGSKYYLYVHSYLNYGLSAARGQILGVAKDADNPCILAGYSGVYTYGGVDYKVSALSSGSSINKCRKEVLKALNVDEPCPYTKCTFGGVWNGGGGDGQNNLYVGSYFHDRALQVGFINATDHVAKVRPKDFKAAAQRACQTTLEDAKSTYPGVDDADLPYICMDLVYEYTLLIDGFGLKPSKDITLMKQITYQDSLVEAAWPLGSALELISSGNTIEWMR